jgi:hypothetical protein
MNNNNGGVRQDWLMLAEAINMSSSIDDTEKLAPRRGASMAMREAIRGIYKATIDSVDGEIGLIRQGGSIALLSISDVSPDKVLRVKEAANNWLSGNARSYPDELPGNVLKQIGFAVAVVPASDDMHRDVQKLRSIIRFEQLSGADRYFHDLCGIESTAEVCELDGKRPAENDKKSGTVKLKARYGRERKQGFINQEIGCKGENGYAFTNDLEALSDGRDKKIAPAVDGKMAVLYFDGNHFGKHQEKLKREQLREFDEELEEKRRQFLKDLVKRFDAEEKLKTRKCGESIKECLRIEILQWGGDEVLFIVPGWAGFSTLKLFYDSMTGLGERLFGQSLSHAGGLVFCSHKTPIQRVTSLVHELADYAKQFSRETDLYFPMLLESEDYPVRHASEHWREHYGALGGRMLPLTSPSDTRGLSILGDIETKNVKGLFRRWVLSRYAGKNEALLEQELAEAVNLEKLIQAGETIFSCIPKTGITRQTQLNRLLLEDVLSHYENTFSLQPLVQLLEYWDYIIQDPLLEKLS